MIKDFVDVTFATEFRCNFFRPEREHKTHASISPRGAMTLLIVPGASVTPFCSDERRRLFLSCTKMNEFDLEIFGGCF